MSRRAGPKGRKDREAPPLLDVPVLELSGLDVEPRPDGSLLLWAVGDTNGVVARAPLGPDGRPGTWETVDLATFAGVATGADVTQLEGVACDGVSRLVLLREHPSEILVVDTVRRELLSRQALRVTEAFPRAKELWESDRSSAGEGVLLLRRGHLLVVKEKNPAGFAEFGPAGDEPLGASAATLLPQAEAWAVAAGEDLVLLDRWLPEYGPHRPLGDVSDMATTPDGGILVLSDRSRALAPLAGPLTPGSGQVEVSAPRPLPLGAKAKPEGLVVLDDGTVLVGIDTKKPRRNLLVLPPV